MSSLVTALVPIFALFVLGLALRGAGVLQARHAERLLRVVIHMGLPALILGTVSRVPLQREFALLPLGAAFVALSTGLAAWSVGRRLALPRATLGVFVIGPMIMNLAVAYPFVAAAWGDLGIARLVMFDFANAVLTFTLVYAIAGSHGARAAGWRRRALGMLAFPPFWALAVALAMNAGGVAFPEWLADGLAALGRLLVLLVMVALGIYFEISRAHRGPVLAASGLRAGLGLLLGWLWCALFGLDGVTRAVLLCAAAAPVGFNTLVYASLHHLDRRFASALVSASLMAALIYLPVMLFLL